MQEVIAFVYRWPPDALDELTLDQLEMWGETARLRAEQMTAHRCPLLQ